MGSQDFLKIAVEINDETREAIANFLFETGALGLIEQNNQVHAYFDSSRKEAEILDVLFIFLNSLRQVLGSAFDIWVSTEQIQNRDWNAEWKSSLGPIVVSDTVIIKPSWVETPVPFPPVVIEIDPEMAFGSGEHATTKLTLRLVEKNIQPHTRMLDVGTGTGVLALAALLLGADFVCAFDIDPVAAQTAKRNAAKNGVANRCCIFTGTLESLREQQFDLIAANVNRSQILKLLPRMWALLAPDGLCLISGILDYEEQIFRDACIKNDFVVNKCLQEQEWLAFETRKK